MSTSAPTMPTIGEIARWLSEPVHRVAYVIGAEISGPAVGQEMLCVFPDEAVVLIAAELHRIDGTDAKAQWRPVGVVARTGFLPSSAGFDCRRVHQLTNARWLSHRACYQNRIPTTDILSRRAPLSNSGSAASEDHNGDDAESASARQFGRATSFRRSSIPIADYGAACRRDSGGSRYGPVHMGCGGLDPTAGTHRRRPSGAPMNCANGSMQDALAARVGGRT